MRILRTWAGTVPARLACQRSWRSAMRRANPGAGETEIVMMKRLVAGMWMFGCVAALWLVAPGVAQARKLSAVSSRGSRSASTSAISPCAVRTRVRTATSCSPICRRWRLSSSDFNFATFGGEWRSPSATTSKAALGAGFYQRTVPSVYRNVTHENDAEIAQELKLRSGATDGDGASSCRSAVGRYSPTLAPASVSSTGTTAKSVSSSTSATTRFSGPDTSERRKRRRPRHHRGHSRAGGQTSG